MGVGVSSLRLRKALVIRAYNLREEDETLDEQFRKLCFYSNQEEHSSGSRDGSDSGSGKGELTLNLDDVKQYLGFGSGSGSGSSTFDRLLGGTLLGQRIPFKAFVDFLDTGSTPSMGLPIPDPSAVDENVENVCLSSDGTTEAASGPGSVSNSSHASDEGAPKSSASANASASASSSNKKGPGSILRAKFPTSRSGNPPSPPQATGGGESPISLGSSASVRRAGGRGSGNSKGGSSSSRTAAALAFARTAADADYTEMEEQEADGAEAGDEGTYDGTDCELRSDVAPEVNGPQSCMSPTLARPRSSLDLILSRNPEALQRSSSGNIWQKREVVTQERTVHYTTIDDDGVLQELIEKETSQTEVLHMESRDTGVFAHRETTLYDQTETFNSQVVAETHGVEEYVHMRSEDDEYEYMDSNMPEGKGRNGGGGGQEQDPQISPRAQQGRGNPSDDQYYDYDADGSYASPQFSHYQAGNGIDPKHGHAGDEEHVHMPGRGKPPGFNLHLNLDPLKRASAQDNGAGADGSANGGAGPGQGFNPTLDTSKMDDETKAYYEYLQATQAHSAEQIRMAEAEIAEKNAMSDMCDSPSPGHARRSGPGEDRGAEERNYCPNDSTEVSPEISLDQRRRARTAAGRQSQRSAFKEYADVGDEGEYRKKNEGEEDEAGDFVGVGAAADAALRALRTAAVEAEDEAMYAEQKAVTEATSAALKMFAEAKAAQKAADTGAGMETRVDSLMFSQEIEEDGGGEEGDHVAFINVETKGHISDID